MMIKMLADQRIKKNVFLIDEHGLELHYDQDSDKSEETNQIKINIQASKVSYMYVGKII